MKLKERRLVKVDVYVGRNALLSQNAAAAAKAFCDESERKKGRNPRTFSPDDASHFRCIKDKGAVATNPHFLRHVEDSLKENHNPISIGGQGS